MKQKSHSGIKKRVKVKKGKIFLQKSCKRHLLSNKSKSQKKLDQGGKELSPANMKTVRRMLPHS